MEMISAEGCLPAYMNPSEQNGLPGAGSQTLPFGIFTANDVRTIHAVTDLGRTVPLFHYEAAYILRPGQQLDANNVAQCKAAFRASEYQFLTNSQQDVEKLVRLLDPYLGANCHGWVFARGRFGIKDEFIADILADHAYIQVEEPTSGDLAVYFHEGVAVHSGFARRSDAGSVIVESKWGPFGVFRHPPEAYAFPGTCAFYRSPRATHELSFRPVSQ